MKKPLQLALIGLCTFASLSGARAEKESARETIAQISKSAEDDLAKSVEQLNKLREKIAAEKLPMAQELSAKEDELAKLRRDHDGVTRLVDSGNLELLTIKADMKARQDELSYIGNILDEYARTFETKANTCELQYCGQALEAAKQATENNALTPPERFTLQLDFVGVSVKRLFDAIGGMKFPGVGVDGEGVVQQGEFAIIGPVALFASEDGTASGLAIPQSGSPNPLIRPLEGAIQAGVAPLVKNGEGALPLDPSRGGALKAMVQKTDLKHIFEKGGPIMWPLLASAILAILTVTQRVLFLMLESLRRSPKALDAFFAAVTRRDTDEAIRISKKSKYYVLRVLGYALEHREKSLTSALMYARENELKRFKRGIPMLDTVITLAPLLGLLGTVTGMMGSFSLIGGDLGAPGAITGGIAEALIATAFGLGIAITCLIPFNYLNAKIEEARIEIETAATQLELQIHPEPVEEEDETETPEPDELVPAEV